MFLLHTNWKPLGKVSNLYCGLTKSMYFWLNYLSFSFMKDNIASTRMIRSIPLRNYAEHLMPEEGNENGRIER